MGRGADEPLADGGEGMVLEGDGIAGGGLSRELSSVAVVLLVLSLTLCMWMKGSPLAPFANGTLGGLYVPCKTKPKVYPAKRLRNVHP